MEIQFLYDVFDVWEKTFNAENTFSDLFDEEGCLDYTKLLGNKRVQFGLTYWNVFDKFVPFIFPSTFYPSKIVISQAYDKTNGDCKQLLKHVLQSNTIALLRKPFENQDQLDIFLSKSVDMFQKSLNEDIQFATERLKEKIKRRLGVSGDIVDGNETPFSVFKKYYDESKVIKSSSELEDMCLKNAVTGKYIHTENLIENKHKDVQLYKHEAYGFQLMHDINYALLSLKTQIFDATKLDLSTDFFKSCPYFHVMTLATNSPHKETASPSCILVQNKDDSGIQYEHYKNKNIVDNGIFSMYPKDGQEKIKSIMITGDKKSELFYNTWGKYMKLRPKSVKKVETPVLTGEDVPIVLYLDTRPLDFWKKSSIYTTLNNLKPNTWRLMILTNENNKRLYEDEFGKDNVFTILNEWNRSDYDTMMKKKEFWQFLMDKGYNGKCLCIQDDGILFRKGLEDSEMWNYSYVGAPLADTELNRNSVGEEQLKKGLNGGLSLRSIQEMYNVCDTYEKEKHYLFKNNTFECPEDVYFSKYAANVAPRDVASKFSSEQVMNVNSLGIHNAWMYVPQEIIPYFNELLKETTSQ